MYETALFYEDFAVENADGYLDLYPSVSPENTPSNIDRLKIRGSIETTKNATMEFALLKELLTNLLAGCKFTEMYPEKWSTWENMLSKIRPYRINSDGAVAEWIDPYYEDNYHHRHHSHVYPVFPGSEITPDSELYGAFERAEELPARRWNIRSVELVGGVHGGNRGAYAQTGRRAAHNRNYHAHLPDEQPVHPA